MFEAIRNIIKTKLQGIGLIQYVYDYPTEDFNGYPAAVVRSMSNESDYETTIENIRTYIFTIYLYQESESDLNDRRNARRILEGVVDDVMNNFDDDQFLDGISLPSSDYVMVGVRPVLADIVDEDKYVIAEVGLAVRISYDIST